MFTKKRSHILSITIAIILFGVAACSPATPATPTVNANDIGTQAAETVAVGFTQTVAAAPKPTDTVAPTNTPQPATPTVAQVTQPPAPAAATNTPASNPQPVSDDAASFVADVTIPDGTAVAPGSPFAKTWRIKNTGKSTWTTTYALVFIDGERMGAPDSVNLPKEVKPGETVDITVNLTAPSKTGTFQAYYRLRNASNTFFRLDGSGDLWLKIVSGGATSTPAITSTPTETPTVTSTLQ